MSTENPYPNGLAWRVGEAERRLGRIEEGAPGTVVETMREAIADLRGEVKEVRLEIKGLKRATWVQNGAIVGTLAAVLELIRQVS